MIDESNCKLTEDEIAHIEMLVKSPGFNVLKKLMYQQIQACKHALCSAENMTDVTRWQGRIAGLHSLTNVPEVMATKMAAQRERKQKIEAAKKKPSTR